MADIAKLYELQKIDGTTQKVRRRLAQLKTLLVESDDLKRARTQTETLQAEQQEWHSKQKNAELETQSLTDRIKEGEQRLMSGQVRNPKELESLQSSIEALQRQRGIIENASVEALLKNGPNAIRECKELISAVAWKPLTPEVVEDTAQRICRVRGSAEGREGMGAFLEKRKPNWVQNS